MANFNSINRAAAFSPTSAFPLDSREYFESYNEALTAARTAEEAGSSNTVYYYGQVLTVVNLENNTADLYKIMPDKTLSKVGSDIELTSENVTYGEDSNVKREIDSIKTSVEELKNNPGVKKFANIDEANEALNIAAITLGDVCAVAYTPDDGSYVNDYKLYVVAEKTQGVYELKELAGAGGGEIAAGKVTVTVDEFLIDNVNMLGENVYEANIGSTLTFKFRFESENYPDVRGSIYIKRGSEFIYNQKIFPNGDLNTFTYKTDNLSVGTHTFSIYGSDSSGRRSDTTTFRILVGGLNLVSTFDETKTLIAGEDLRIPIITSAADASSAVTARVECDGEEIYSRKLENPSSSYTLVIPGESISIGIHTIKVWLSNTNNKKSNELVYNITVAEDGIIYLISDEVFTAAEGARLDVLLRVVQVGQESSIFNGDLVVKDKAGETVRTGRYTLEYGQNLISLINLPHTEDGDYTEYDATITVSPTEDNIVDPASKTVKLRITENNYNISTLGDDALECCFISEGKTNNSEDRDQWEDLSGKGVKASFNNFNWNTNGWLLDDDGNTALTLNAGAYVELDITPFAKELAEGESMTISIDYSTKDILDSEAKVVSCLQETEGDESTVYYLRDNFGDYIEKGDANVINYFKNMGGYCFVNGEEYEADGATEYLTTSIVSNRTPNYNMGDENPNYDGKVDFRKFLGSSRATVIKQRGFYIDTQYAVLSHSGSLSNVLEKFYLNFTEDTRNRMDFIITRNPSADPNVNPYCFQAMVGYTNGVLSLMKALSSEEKFEQANIRGDKFKVYLGGKGVINPNDGSVKVEQTGSAKIYSFRIYNRALTPGEILNNYAAEIPDMDKKKSVIDNNDILNTGNIAQLPQVCFIGYNKGGNSDNNTVKKFIMQLKDNGDTPISDLKAMKEPAYMTYTDPSDTSKSWTMKDANGNETTVIPIRLQFQGTSSMVYPVKNYKFKMYEGFTEDSNGKISYIGKYKRDIGNGNKESTICLKADFMDSSHTNNTGSANFISDYNTLSGTTPASELDASYRTTVYGYPILLYYKLNETDTEQKFIGVYNLNLDKSCTGSFGFEEELEDEEKAVYDFKEVRYIDDDVSSDILVRSTVSGEGLTDTGETMNIVIKGDDGEYHKVSANIMRNTDGINYAALYNGIYYRINYIETKITINDKGKEVKSYIPNNSNIGTPYIVLKNPLDNIECALLTDKNFIRTLSYDKVSSTQCDEFKANSGAAGAGGFGSYAIPSISKDLECRYPDDGDLEDEQYDSYKKLMTSIESKPIDFSYFKAGWYYNYQRMMKWVKNSSESEFLENVSRHFNKTYLMDYYLTIMLLGGVDSLGKNLMVATWGPENHLFVTTADALDPKSDKYDSKAFEYEIGGETVYLTASKVKTNGNYIHATNEDGLLLYYKEEYYNRATLLFENGHTKFDADCVTTVPGDDIFYPIFYDIDTINGLDNSGQLLFDVDIEIGDQLSDGTAIFNTDDSHLWRRVRDYLGKNGDLAERWSTLRSYGYFTKENLIDKFYYERQIAKIPEKYYNDDCFLKYIYEGPNPQKGSGTYLYCIHGSRYEHIKRWYIQRMYYIDSMFGIMGGSNSSLRFNHGSYDANFGHTTDYYASYPALAAANPEKYTYDQENNMLLDASTGREIIPIDFNVRTYQPAYVGVKWANTGSILYYRVGRDETVTMRGNVPSAGDSEVFIFGDVNVKELGDLSPYNVKQVDFKNLTKLSKLILGSSEYSTVINKLDLGANSYLAELQLTNCTSLSTVDVSGCSNLRSIDMTGSGITTVTLPIGGSLESIAYSDVITSINLRDFVNLSTVTTPSLTNLTQLIVKNCPKILGTKDIPNAKGWALLQQTRLATNLTTIEMTSYGKVDPVMTSSGEFFFADKYYNYATSNKIAGEVSYSGSTIPANYSRFATAYPKLNIKYTNITDGSEMFANYRNLQCIQKTLAYIGDNAYGEAQYKEVFYWTDDTEELKAKWQTEEKYSQYGIVTTYDPNVNNRYYLKDGVYYRPLGICDDADRDRLRKEIKTNLSNFNGIKFLNVSGMFRNIEVLDYLDPDTFNGIDLSAADTDEMFYGCKSLRYFEVPGDITKNEPVYIYLNEQGEEVDLGDWDESTGSKIHKTDSDGNVLYREIFTGNTTTSKETTYPKGMRNLGKKMFYECRRARVLVKKLSNNDRFSIQNDTFEYILYNPALEGQDRTVTCERPVIMFEHDAKDLLTLIDKPTRTFGDNVIELESAGNGLYFDVYDTGERIINFDNALINFNNSSNYLREVYFNVNELIINDDNIDEDFVISYGKREDNSIIVIDALSKTDSTFFNKSSSTITNNKLNIYSITQGAFEKIVGKVNDFEIPFPNYDCFDVNIPRQSYENSILSYFTSENYTEMDPEVIEKIMPPVSNIFIVNTKKIPAYGFAYMSNILYVGVDETVKEIADYAFYKCSRLNRLSYMRYTSSAYAKYGQLYISVTKIGNSAFEGTGLYGELYLPDVLEKLGTYVFSGCKGITYVRFSSLLKEIPEGTFMECLALTNIQNIGKDITAIKENAFNNCESLDLFPLKQDPYTDGGCSLTPDGQNLDYFTSLETIGDNAFYRCNMISIGVVSDDDISSTKRTIVIPDNIKYIGTSAFYQDIGGVSNITVEFIWSGTNYSDLMIMSNAFTNIRTAWKPEGYDLPVEDAIYIPRVSLISDNAFKSRGTSKFIFALAEQSKDEIGDKWIATVGKIIYDYKGMAAVTSEAGTAREYIATYLFSNNGTEKYAYLYNIDRAISFFDIPAYIEYNSEKFALKEILTGSLDKSEGTLSIIIFKEDGLLDTIEKDVLKSDILSTIVTEGADGVEHEGVIPEGLAIMPGNKLKSTSWFKSIDTPGFVILGKYIIGYISGENEVVETLDMSVGQASSCYTVYDNAFENMTTVKSIKLSNNFKNINKEAFAKCLGITEILLPNGLETIGDSAFIDCPISELVIPSSVTSVGSNAFGVSSGIGKLTSVIIEDGSTINSTPFTISKEVKTGSTPNEVNITLLRLHIPSTSEDPVPSSSLRLLSQVRKLTVGSLKKNENDGSYLIDSYPLYDAGDAGITIINNEEGTLPHAKDADGNLLYCPAFYYDMVKETYPNLFIETKNAKDYYPLPTYSRDLDIGYIMKYPEIEPSDKNTDISALESTLADLTREDIMRIISGFSKTGDIRTISIRASDFKKLTSSDKRIISNYKVTLKQYEKR